MMISVMIVSWFGISIEACLVCNPSSVQSNSEPAVSTGHKRFSPVQSHGLISNEFDLSLDFL
ncbi:hypothetical protein BO70DRAFT_365526 [Aspergillus heteromorphus CBS 117.55]|uniref:Uncharacterized protein n=1 Tax=Aspergillus heteromorphus CBS 117.55 TaxID=1448321 RepID=A0A317VA48_9EURO|nr:uncharacterized protein BO70DRAFT_365526 [Aspergillus heteromorphus CBS 117.55]PWY70219.1 hypothetical protein BO70DRAFT_365526 [Aspergillus heteromorphus CBS 117.55]